MMTQQKSLGRGQAGQGLTAYQNSRTDHNCTAPEQQFREAALAHGFALPADLIADGDIHRFHDVRDKLGSKNAWYAFHLDGCPAAAFGSWKTGERYTWRAAGGCDVANADEYRRKIEADRIRREQALAESHRKAAIKARRTLGYAELPNPEGAYLVRHNTLPLGLRQTGVVLLNPMFNIDGELVNLQRIFPDGQKRFLHGGQVAGAFSLLGGPIDPEGILYICEGWATGAAVHLDSGAPVACALSSHNLLAVAAAWQARCPHLEIIIAGDDDRQNPTNPGRTKAIEAATRTQSKLVFPEFCRPDCECSDFSDLYCCRLAGGSA